MAKKLTTEEFIEKARQVHGDKYDYSKVEYVKNNLNICIICPKHGEFWQRPDKHLLNHGCPMCGGTKQVTTDEFIEKARKVHGNKYDYSKVEYVNNNTKVCIICPIHGEFWQLPSNHLKGKGCKGCAKNLPHPTKLTIDDFITRARQVHGDKYDYSSTAYKNMLEKVKIICKDHGEFEQLPSSHLQGNGCPICSHTLLGEKKRSNSIEFIEKARQVHGDKYDYSKVDYTTAKSKINIICKEHGEFEQAPYHHLQGCGCPVCAGTKKLTTDEFIERAKQVHGDKYDYSKVEYENAQSKILISCPTHGTFQQMPSKHLLGQGCPYCVSYHLEEDVENALRDNNIAYEKQKKFMWLGKQSLDFFLTDYNIAIECQGIQHFESKEYFGGEKQLIEQKKLDSSKLEKCSLHDVEILYYSKLGIEYPYKVYENIDDILSIVLNRSKVNHIKINNSNVEKIQIDDTKVDIPTSLTDFIFSIIDKEKVEIHNTTVIGENITFFIPTLNVGIMYNKLSNGDGRLFSEKTFNLTKLNKCKERGIHLLQIFEDEYFYNRKIVENKIAHILKCQQSLPTIMGRKCQIRLVNKETAQKFLTEYHIQGYTPSTIYIGAFYNEELVACMSFKRDSDRTKKIEDNAWDLTRFASNYNYVCQGIGGKLFNYFKKNYVFSEIKSFADRRWTIDEERNIYKQLGFEFDFYLQPDYRYIDDSDHPIRGHKFNFRIHSLHKKYGVPLTMTEREMTNYLGFIRVYDCGLIRYVYKNKEDK